MSEAIISRAGRGGSTTSGGNSSVSRIMKTEFVTSTKVWTAPQAIDNKFYVRIFGGGGEGQHLTTTTDFTNYTNWYEGAGGAGGWMNNGEFIIGYSNQVNITIGLGGGYNTSTSSGGTTSFGSYLSANGGQCPDGMGGRAGSGGSGGGGGSREFSTGGIGYQFGGGGAIARVNTSNLSTGNAKSGGNGGIWGGGGGSTFGATVGYGGTYGGNGGNNTLSATCGINTALMQDSYEIDNDVSGSPIIGHSKNGSAYGFMGFYAGGGGGGFGGNGGNGGLQSSLTFVDGNDGILAGGGGGGYGANGGNGNGGGGGGGGYGAAGYGGRGNMGYGGGGGSYGRGGTYGVEDPIYGGGGHGNNGFGANGVCIIQWYAYE